MNRGMYVSASGGLLAAKRLDVVANNIANANTIGYKAEKLVSRQQEFSDTLASTIPGSDVRKGDFDRTPAVVGLETRTDFTPGPVEFTGNPLNVALSHPNDFFTVTTVNGDAYTRAGNFTLNSDGTLVTADGFPVQGDGGPIQLAGQEPARIASDGSVFQGQEIVGRIGVVRINAPEGLNRVDGTRFSTIGAQAGEAVDNPGLIQESVEMPNIAVVEGMVDMINAQRAFEAYTKTAQTITELNEIANRTARLSG
jgi:flagellar basal-body rod protein FlgF